MLKILPIILSRISQIFFLLFFLVVVEPNLLFQNNARLDTDVNYQNSLNFAS